MNLVERLRSTPYAICHEAADEIDRLSRIHGNMHTSEGGWIYQGDDEDHLESLTCPVVIQPDQLRGLIDTHRELLEACEQAEAALADALHAGEAGCCDPHLSVEYATKAIRAVQAAIAKAKGGRNEL